MVLGASRVIYTPGSKGQIVPVLNEQDYPMLVQTRVTVDEDSEDAPSGRFSAVPPLFRLDSQQRAKVRIVHTGGEFPEDRESLYWVCIKGVPPSGEDSWANGQAPDRATLMVQTIINNCIKLLVRPKALAGKDALAMAERLSWRLDKQGLTATNSTPFYINLSALTVGGKTVEQVGHIAPFASHTFALPAGAKGELQWRAINDLGGEGPLLRAPLP
ncbi:fimbria/pilus periplasmic chaperone [Aeromonas hydrophila]|uniref:fimbria/pilus periplasmic chaperone n=1 Tax=Aeromonas hydrophila TaxID=644 RepID=UPI000970EACB|nr:fimbria/pilus periplasmic chaperone [Aeromonas hydrophila]